MATDTPAPAASGPAGAEPRHGLRLLILWLVASAI